MLAFYKKYWRTAFDIGLIVLTVYLIMLAFSYIYKIATPVLLAFVVYAAIEPFAAFLHRKKIKKSIASAISVILFTTIIIGVFVGAGAVVTIQANKLIGKIPGYFDILKNQVLATTEYIGAKFRALPPDLTENAQGYTEKAAQFGTELLQSFFNGLLRFLTSFTTFLAYLVIAIILAYFLSVEIVRWRKFAEEKTPSTFKSAFLFVKENVMKGILAYIKAQLKLITITFFILLIGMMIMRVDNALTIALISALFDMLPIVGVATIFIPWIIYLFIIGNYALAVGLLALFCLVTLFRQILEPKITGNTLGVSAFTMFSFMIISLSLFGVAGLILSPILIILIKALYEQGYLQSWIRLPAEDYAEGATPLKPTFDPKGTKNTKDTKKPKI